MLLQMWRGGSPPLHETCSAVFKTLILLEANQCSAGASVSATVCHRHVHAQLHSQTDFGASMAFADQQTRSTSYLVNWFSSSAAPRWRCPPPDGVYVSAIAARPVLSGRNAAIISTCVVRLLVPAGTPLSLLVALNWSPVRPPVGNHAVCAGSSVAAGKNRS